MAYWGNFQRDFFFFRGVVGTYLTFLARFWLDLFIIFRLDSKYCAGR